MKFFISLETFDNPRSQDINKAQLQAEKAVNDILNTSDFGFSQIENELMMVVRIFPEEMRLRMPPKRLEEVVKYRPKDKSFITALNLPYEEIVDKSIDQIEKVFIELLFVALEKVKHKKVEGDYNRLTQNLSTLR